VKIAALRLDLGPVLQPKTLKGAEGRAPILAFMPDAIVVVAYGRILPGRLIDAPRFGVVNLHFSLLPRHRGASPVQYTLLCGDELAGVTTILIQRELDAGPVLMQRATEIQPRETASALGLRLARDGAQVLLETLDLLEQGGITPQLQDEALATWAPVLTKEDGHVRWDLPATELERRVRAFDPWPPVVCRGPRGPLRLLRVEVASAPAPAGTPPGFVLERAGDAVEVAAGAGTRLRVREVQPANGRPITAAAALAGRHFAIGDRLLDGNGR
jgi:methionyl-tRNA formyltransferase